MAQVGKSQSVPSTYTHAVAGEEDALQVSVLVLRDLEQARGLIEHRTSRVLVRLERVGGNQDEGGAGVEDARGRLEDGRVRAVLDRHVETPVVRRGGRARPRPASSGRTLASKSSILFRFKSDSDGQEGRDVRELDVARELGGVGAAERDQAVGGRDLRGGREREAEDISGHLALVVRVVEQRRDDVGVGDSVDRQARGADAGEQCEHFIITARQSRPVDATSHTQGCRRRPSGGGSSSYGWRHRCPGP